MSDLISRQAAIDALIGITTFKTKHELMQRVNASVQDEQGWLGAVAECLDEIEDLPSAQPERKRGRWNCSDDMYESAVCSVCGWDTTEPWDHIRHWFNYCPNCGADMREVE